MTYWQSLRESFVSAFRQIGLRGRQTMGYYDTRAAGSSWRMASQYVLFDRFFSSATDGSGSNHFFWVGAYPADPHDTPKGGFTRPTICLT